MSEPKQSNFEGWAVVELMGHQREIGFVTTEAFGQAVMFRIDTPEIAAREYSLNRPEWIETENGQSLAPAGSKVQREALPGRSRLVAPGSLYAINPCTEEAARAAIDKSSQRALKLIELPPGKALPAAVQEEDNDEDHYFDEMEARR